MDAQDREWKARFAARPPRAAGSPCPRLETLSTWAKGSLPQEAMSHLAACADCGRELVEVRRALAEKATEVGRAALRTRLHALMPARRVPYGWIAAAAVVVIAVLAAVLTQGKDPVAPPKPVVLQPKETPQPAPVREVPFEPPSVFDKPAPPVAVPKPPEKLPAPPVAEPVQKPPVVVKTAPEPEKPAPVPEKPAPALTRARLRGSLVAVAGTVATQLDADPWQPLRVAQSRDFTGVVKVKADVAANRFRVGAATCSLQRGAELALTLEEGRTQVTLARGEAFFDVTPGRDPFEVETPHGRVAVKGTRFLVAVEKNETEVAVQRGAVQFNAVALAAGERSAGGPPQKADLTKRLAWVRVLEETLRIEADQMVLAGGMAILPDPTASGGRAIGIKDPLKAGQEAVAEIPAKRKQPAPYAVWIRLHWAHGVPSALTLTVGDALTWSSKPVAASPNWQWVRAGSAELPDGTFRIRLTDTQPGLRIDQIVLTTDPEFSPEQDKK